MSNKKRRMTPTHRNFFEKHRGDILTALILVPLIALAVWASSGHLRLSSNANAIDTTASNPIGIQQSANPADTDIASLQDAERGALGQPALIWFHADW